jgi:hypothetical protein
MTRWLIVSVLCVLAARADEPQRRVVVVRDPGALRVRAMVATGLTTLTGTSTEAEAWRQFVSSNDVVGIKISTQAAPLQATRRSVVDALVAGLESAGVPATNIWVFDRDPHKLRAAGYTGPREVGIIDGTGWSREVFYESKLVGKLIWGDLLFGRADELNTRSHFPKLLTRTITKLINVPVLQERSGCLDSVTRGLLDNARRFEQYPLPMEPVVKDKLVLNVLDALVAGYAGGPEFKPQYSWPAGALYFSPDPIGVDVVALELIESKRREQKIPALGPAPNAGNRIELIETQP